MLLTHLLPDNRYFSDLLISSHFEQIPLRFPTDVYSQKCTGPGWLRRYRWSGVMKSGLIKVSIKYIIKLIVFCHSMLSADLSYFMVHGEYFMVTVSQTIFC